MAWDKEDTWFHNKHESTQVRKKFRKHPPYRCCGAPTGNKAKPSSRYCCTYPQVYKRNDVAIHNKQVCRELNEDFAVNLVD